MKLEQLHDAMHAAPFQPFTIHTADGRSARVPHSDFIALMDGRTAIVVSPRDESPSYRLIDIPLIMQLEIEGTTLNGAK